MSYMQRLLPGLCIFGGIILALIGAVATIGLLPTLWASSGRFMVDVLGLLILGLLPLGLGLASVWYGKRRLTQDKHAQQAQHDTELTRLILQLAQTRPQGITASDCVAQSTFTMPEVEEALSRLYLDGALDMEVSEQGLLVYKPKPR
jgi:hypothetical protein